MTNGMWVGVVSILFKSLTYSNCNMSIISTKPTNVICSSTKGDIFSFCLLELKERICVAMSDNLDVQTCDSITVLFIIQQHLWYHKCIKADKIITVKK